MELSISDLANNQVANRIGEFLSVRGLLAGDIIRNASRTTVRLRVIDAETRRIVAMATESTEGDVTPLAKDLTSRLVRTLERDYELRGRIQRLMEPNTIKANVGSLHGVRVRQVFDIYPKETDPRAADNVTGFRPVGEVEVTHIGERECIGKVTKAEMPLSPEMRLEKKGAH